MSDDDRPSRGIGNTRAPDSPGPRTRQKTSSWTLVTLILVASVANLNLSVANVALPDIGVLGATLVLLCFPRKDREIALLAQFAAADAAAKRS